MRLKILGLVALAALVAALGTIGLSQKQAAHADPLAGVTVTAGTITCVATTPPATAPCVSTGAAFTVVGLFNEDDSCANGPALCPAIVTVTPAVNVTSILGAVCTIDASVPPNGSLAEEAAGNCAGAPADSDGSANVFTYSAAAVAALDADTINQTWRLSLNVTPTCLTNVVLTITYQQDSLSTPQVTTVTCQTSTVHTISIGKIDQYGALRAATFGLGTTGFSVANAVMSTSSVSAAQNPCASNSATGCATNPNLQNQQGLFLPLGSGGITLPFNTGIEIREIAAPGTCTLVEIKLGLATSIITLPLAYPPVATFDGAVWTVTSAGVVVGTVPGLALNLTYVNSCGVAGGAVSANSSIAVVYGGATYGLTNTTHIEIVPAPGSDNDARLDIRVRDANLVPLTNAHVTVMTNRGSLSLRADTTSLVSLGSGGSAIATPSGYDVVEPTPDLFGSGRAGDTCDQAEGVNPPLTAAGGGTGVTSPYNGYVFSPVFAGSRQIQDGYTNTSGFVSACLYVDSDLAPGITPGKADITVIIENTSPYVSSYQPIYAPQNLVLTASVTVVGPPASVKVAASPTSVQCGEKSTITATVTDSVGQNVSDHTRVELVSNFGSTIGGTGATLGFPGTGPTNPVSSSAAETFSGVATAFLLTSTEHVGPYEVVVATGGSTGGYRTGLYNYGYTTPPNWPGAVYYPSGPVTTVNNSVGAFSTAPVAAQVTVTCALPSIAAPIIPPIVAPRTGEGIRPPNTGDAGLLDLLAD